MSKQINLTARLTTSALPAEMLQPVTLEKLALIPAQTYEAKVVAKASAEILQTLSANLKTATIPATPEPKPDSQDPDSLWLLRVQGKTLLAEIPVGSRSGNITSIAPKPGDILWLQLKPDGSLAFRPAPASSPNQAAMPAPSFAPNLTPLLELTKAQLELHMARTLHQQQPISGVLTQLNPLHQTKTKPETQALLQQVIDILRTKVPNKSLFEILNVPMKQAPEKNSSTLIDTIHTQIARTLQQHLARQGLTFERTLFRTITEGWAPQPSVATPTSATQKTETSTPNASQATTQAASDAKNLSPLKALLQRFSADAVVAPSTSATSSATATFATSATPAQASTALMPQSTLSRQLQFNTAQALETALHPAGTTTEARPNAGSTTPTSPLPDLANLTGNQSSEDGADLKGTLLGLIKEVSQGLAATAPASSKSVAGSAAQNDNLQLLANPLSFPRPMLPPSMLKANAMLADEELSTGQILRLLAGLLHRIQFNQLNSLHQTASNSSDTVTAQSWMFDLPIANNNAQQFDFFQLRLDREKHQARQGEPEGKSRIQWKISLAFNFEGLGQINIHLKLLPPAATSIIWATQADTLQLVQKHTEHLRERLGLLGLNLQDIQYQTGAPVTESRPIQASIVDTRA